MPDTTTAVFPPAPLNERRGPRFSMGGADAYSVHNRADYDRLATQPSQRLIVLVEDNPADVLLLREALASNAVESSLFVANDGDEAIRFIEELEKTRLRCPDLIILDLNLPRKSGFEVLQKVRATSRCCESPVVILSSSGAARDREQAERLGASFYIRKPSTLKDFMAIGAQLKGMLPGSL